MQNTLLTFRHLRALRVIAQTGTISKAALRLNMTQSALSQQIKILEDYYAMPLFIRKSQPLCFTPTGERLLQLASQVLPLLEQAERDIAQLQEGEAGQLRIAVECSTCFDWLMPAMDTFREYWPAVELDIVSGFYKDPLPLLQQNRADIAIVSEQSNSTHAHFSPLFRFEMLGLVGRKHPYADKSYLTAEDFATETLISYPVPDSLLDIMRVILEPAGIQPLRRYSDLTVGILQLVASRRGIAVLPNWSVAGYIERGYILGKRIAETGLWSELYAAKRSDIDTPRYLLEFIEIIRQTSFEHLQGIAPIEE